MCSLQKYTDTIFLITNLKLINMLPSNLSKFGFDTSSDQIQLDSLTEISQFIANNFEKQSTINPIKTSFSLKEIIEKEFGTYIYNGDLIAAMILEGFDFKQVDQNAYFNISKKSLKKFLPCI